LGYHAGVGKLDFSNLDPRKLNLGKLRIGNLGPAVKLFAGLKKEGLTLIADIDLTLKTLPKFSATLLLKWPEVIVICLVLAILGLAVEFRTELAETRLIASWAPEHTSTVAGIIGTMALIVGCLLAFWKKKQLFVYGIWEVVFGVFLAFEIGLVLFPKTDLSQFIGLASALYVISRGAGNVVNAVEDEVTFQRVKWEIEQGQTPEPWPPSILRVRK
jgi:multisubunit Na+/H+ antiporter MnhG subunit